MDKETLEGLVTEAISRGIVGPSLLISARDANVISVRTISRPILLRIYERRLKHTGGDPILLRLTEELVNFLAVYPNDELVMIDVADHAYCHTFLLARPETTEVLHWMRMFGKRNIETGEE
ncbi:hypothetical protein AB0M13_19965 [Nocardia fluminea]|uniref:hypothetical protein n=1 Tax=Nocardia fluminea TaxID=134984 RepID=UPI0034284D1B